MKRLFRFIKIYLIIVFLVFSNINNFGQRVVLWGNSLSYYNNFLSEFNELCRLNNKDLEIKFYAEPGVSVSYWYDHFEKIQKMPVSVDFLVLQNNNASSGNFEITINKIVKKYSKNQVKRIVLFENYSTIKFSKVAKNEERQKIYNFFKNYSEIDSRITVMPIGHIFQDLEDYDLFSSDGHPTDLGTFVYIFRLYFELYKTLPTNHQYGTDIEKYLEFIGK